MSEQVRQAMVLDVAMGIRKRWSAEAIVERLLSIPEVGEAIAQRTGGKPWWKPIDDSTPRDSPLLGIEAYDDGSCSAPQVMVWDHDFEQWQPAETEPLEAPTHWSSLPLPPRVPR